MVFSDSLTNLNLWINSFNWNLPLRQLYIINDWIYSNSNRFFRKVRSFILVYLTRHFYSGYLPIYGTDPSQIKKFFCCLSPFVSSTSDELQHNFRRTIADTHYQYYSQFFFLTDTQRQHMTYDLQLHRLRKLSIR